MKSKLYTSLLLCVGSALVAATTVAQTDPITQPGTATSSPSGRHTGLHGSWMHLRASKINGATVKSASGDTLGTIEDLIINPQNGRAEFAVVSLISPTGPTPTGVGEKLTPIPWRALNLTPSAHADGLDQSPSFTASVDQTKLAGAPNFDKNQWPDLSQKSWFQSIYSYYGFIPESNTGGTGTGIENDKGGTATGTEKGAGAGGLLPKSGSSY